MISSCRVIKRVIQVTENEELLRTLLVLGGISRRTHHLLGANFFFLPATDLMYGGGGRGRGRGRARGGPSGSGRGRSNWSRGGAGGGGSSNSRRPEGGAHQEGQEEGDSTERTRHPPHLRGREIGLYYARLNRDKPKLPKKEINEKHLQSIELDPQMEGNIKSLLKELKPVENGATDWSSSTSSYKTENCYEMKKDGCDGSMRNPCQLVLERDPSLDEGLKQQLETLEERNSTYRNMLRFRCKLPAFTCKNDILELVSSNQVVVISGETGCGKTTQIPQFILDEMISRSNGSLCNLLCTQPRRISAISVAERVAEERGERIGSNSVGYVIRLENRTPSRNKGTITFCTTGVVFQYLKSDPYLTKYSHIILDEVHERDASSDILIAVLRNLMVLRPDLKVILMSATINADQFSRYFNNCPMYNIPGLTFPVEEFYLEDVIQMLRYQFPIEPSQNNSYSSRRVNWESNEWEQFIQKVYIRRLQARNSYLPSTIREISRPESEDAASLLDLTLVLLEQICRTDEVCGAVLIFVTGWGEISDLHNKLLDSGKFSSSHFLLLPLHSMMPTVNQKQIFERPPRGVRKIVISTNIAETSITIDDIVHVIDCGRIKLTNFDQKNNIETLDSEWVSRANAKQRKGRAGRVQAGKCYHLFTKGREEKLEDFKKPEILRKRLEDVILQLKILRIGEVRHFLPKLLDPPSRKSIDLSFERLRRLHALNDDEELTSLGFHLAHLPLDPQIGKMILMAAVFSCIDPIFTIAASLSFKDPFYIPLGKNQIVDRLRVDFAEGTRSDHWAIVKAINGFEVAAHSGYERNYCYTNFLSPSTCNMIINFKQQFCQYLQGMKFLTSSDCKNPMYNINSKNIGLIKSVVCSGLYPNVATLKRRGRNFVMVKTVEDGSVMIHPKSVNAKEVEHESPFLVYHQKQKLSKVMLFDTTMVSPFALIFFGGKLDFFVRSNIPLIEVDTNIRFKITKDTFDTIQGLRVQLDNILMDKIENPTPLNWANKSSEIDVLRAITDLLTTEYRIMMNLDESISDDASDN